MEKMTATRRTYCERMKTLIPFDVQDTLDIGGGRNYSFRTAVASCRGSTVSGLVKGLLGDGVHERSGLRALEASGTRALDCCG